MPPLNHEEICSRIKQARIQAGLSQEKIAGLLHVSRNSVVEYERNRVPWDQLDTIAKITDHPTEWLLYGDEVMIRRDTLGDILKRLAAIERKLGI